MTANWRVLGSRRRTQFPAVHGVLPRDCVRPALESQVLVVVAPAGYGKTTALAAALTPPHVAWLTLDADDIDPQVLAAGLALAVEALPDGAAVGAVLDAGATPQRLASRVAELLHELGAWLVIDEAQHLTSPLLAPVLRELLDCGSGHVALLSRLPLPLSELAPLEAAGVVTYLSAADLSFTPQEMGTLFALQGLSPSSAELRLAHSLTEGWPIAARFLGQAVVQGRVQLADLRDLDQGQAQLGTLFTYLAQEVLGPLAVPLQALLTRSSVFEELTPDLLEEVLQEPQAAAWLEALSSSGTFLTRAGQGVYRAHPLLRAHLRGLLSPDEAQQISGLGAAYFERTGRPRRALAAHLMAGHTARAAALLEAYGAEWLRLGRVNLVQSSLARLPKGSFTPALQALLGDTLRLSSQYEQALTAYAGADPLSRALGEIQVALDTVQPDHAWAALSDAEQLAAPEQQDLLRRLRAENLLNAGRLTEAVALEPSLAGGIRYALRSGQVEQALALAQSAIAGEQGGARAAQNHRESLLLASFLHSVLGQWEEAAGLAREGLAEGTRLESPFVQALALARLGHAQQVAGAHAEAEANYNAALGLARGVTGRLQVEPLMGLAYLAGARGDHERAARLHAEALAQTGGDQYMAGLLHLTTALGALQGGGAAPAYLDAADAAFAVCGDTLGQTAVALARFAADPEAKASRELAESVLKYPFLLGRASLFSPFQERARRAHVLSRLAAPWPDLHAGLRPLAAALGYSQIPAPQHTPGFEVRAGVLGRAEIVRAGGRPAEWSRAKARELLALLVVRAEGLPRVAAQEALFPDAEAGIGERNFRVTLHALTSVLEEGAEGGTFLERGEWLRLRPSPDLRVDLWEAQGHLSAPAGTAGRLDALLRLPERFYDSDLPEVQQAAAAYTAALPEALAEEAQAALSRRDLPSAIRAAERSLSLDPAHEPAARVLMSAHLQRGNAAHAQRVYAALSAALEQLGLSPLPETAALYRALGVGR